MAETAGPIDGTLVKLYNGTVPVANLIATNIKVGKKMIDVSSKDSAGWDEFIGGRANWTMDCESVLEYDTSVGTAGESIKEILDDLIAGTSWTAVIGSGTSGDMKLSGAAFIMDVSISHPDNDKSTFSVSLQGTGALTVGTFA